MKREWTEEEIQNLIRFVEDRSSDRLITTIGCIPYDKYIMDETHVPKEKENK